VRHDRLGELQRAEDVDVEHLPPFVEVDVG
jgi:hypothetical protein